MIWEIEFLGRNYYITNKVKPLTDMKIKIITTILYVTAGLTGILLAYLICSYVDSKFGEDNIFPFLLMPVVIGILESITANMKK